MSLGQIKPAPPDHPRQAVVLIHGIGEQRPMDTLRDFVAAFLDKDSYHSKPDTLSDSYELRRIKLRRAQASERAPAGVNPDWPETDFYEYYWAHQMYGTTASHVVAWLVRTLCSGLRIIRRAPADYRRLTRLAYWAWGLTLAAFVGVAAGAWWAAAIMEKMSASGAVGMGALVLLALFALRQALKVVPRWALEVVLESVGDAARYFDVNPKNVARRYDILRGGVALLKKLHDEHDQQGDDVIYRYGRIVLVGHSLGSVIAYDILRFYWGEVNGLIDLSRTTVADVEAFRWPQSEHEPSATKPYDNASRFHQAQYELWNCINERVPAGERMRLSKLWCRHASNVGRPPTSAGDKRPPSGWRPARWLVSDLVTLGSPLAHAPVLLACDAPDLEQKIKLRELPTCPPDRSRHLNPGSFVVGLAAEAERLDQYDILHHGACFAVTRWTNFWYPNDPVGGPLQPPFGCGIDDVRLPNASPLMSHLKYWHPAQGIEWSRLRDILMGTHGRLFCPLSQAESEPGHGGGVNPGVAAVA